MVIDVVKVVFVTCSSLRVEMSLEEYRKKASFQIEALQEIIDEEDGVELKQYIWDLLDKDPIFHQPRDDLTIEQEQELTFRRVKRLAEHDIEYFVTPAKQAAFLSALCAFDCSLPILHGVNNIVSILKQMMQIHCRGGWLSTPRDG